MKKILCSLMLISGIATLSAQVLIDDTATAGTPNENAILELNSEDKGLLLPRIEGLSPNLAVEGMMYYDTWGKCFRAYGSNGWQVLGDDCLPETAYTITVSDADPATVIEVEDQTFTVTVSPAVVAGTTVTVDYTTADGTAIAGEDYTSISGTLTFTEGQTSQTITVNTLTDEVEDENRIESYSVNLSNPQVTGYASSNISVSSGTGNIQDADAAIATYSEDFEDVSLPASYGNGSFDGEHQTTWSYYQSRNDSGYEISGSNALMLRDTSSRLEIIFPNGINEISFDYRKAFTGGAARQFEIVKVVGTTETVLFTSPVFGNTSGADATIHSTGDISVTESDNTTVIIRNISAGQMNLDNFIWTR